MIKLLPLESLYFEDVFYPREKEDWRAKHNYKQALLAGANFPPIIVIPRKSNKGVYLVIDGWHRTQACKELKEKNIRAELLTGLTDKQI